ncbi:MAG: acyl-CoA dehydrogenase family protein [Chloroflexi bacterium]|nr:acyl-CoA dehydrogenase family protein [Chloroflexota bacterium]
MDFQFDAADEAFRKEIATFAKSRLPADWDTQNLDEEEAHAFGRENAMMIQADEKKQWLTMAWPREHGGQGASHWRQMIFNWETAYHRLPIVTGQGIPLVGPTIMIHGTEEQKKRWLPLIAKNEEQWCQLFTEPGAGSDLASLQTRAVADGDDFVVNGQKIFTSGGHHAGLGWLLARTDPNAPKHRGISAFIVELPKTQGVTIRPLINMAGLHAQNEFFFDDARVPRENMIGEQNRGWYVAATTLDFERSGVGRYAQAQRLLEELVEFTSETRLNGHTLAQEPRVRNRIANMAIENEVGKYISFRIVWMQSNKLVPNREASMSKVWGAEMQQRLANVGLQIMGLYGGLRRGSRYAPMAGRFEHLYKTTVVGSIAGGSSEVNRNIIATRGLGLPR